MSHSIASASQLLVENLSLIKNSVGDQGVLDLACGKGRNGLYLLQNSIPVTFVDKNEEVLESVAQSIEYLAQDKAKAKLENSSSLASAKCWQVDLEQGDISSLQAQCFDVVLVFN